MLDFATPPKKKSEWEKICAASKGQRVLLTGEQETSARAFQKLLEEQVKKANEYNKATAIFEHAKDNYFFSLREELEKIGVPEIWELGMGFDENAKSDGVMVINLNKNPQQPR